MWTVVDLPAPFGPEEAVDLARLDPREMPSTARGPFLKTRTRSWTSMPFLDAVDAIRPPFVAGLR